MEGGRSHKEEMERPMGKGWVDTGGDRGRELRRVPYLAGVRNKVLEVLEVLERGVRVLRRRGESRGGKMIRVVRMGRGRKGRVRGD